MKYSIFIYTPKMIRELLCGLHYDLSSVMCTRKYVTNKALFLPAKFELCSNYKWWGKAQ